jgi:hypothetical protein
MIDIPLDYPIEIDGVLVKSLKLRRPKVRDMIVSVKGLAGNEEKEVKLFANLCEVTDRDIEELDLSDYKKLQNKFNDFLSSKSDPVGRLS